MRDVRYLSTHNYSDPRYTPVGLCSGCNGFSFVGYELPAHVGLPTRTYLILRHKHGR